MIGVLCHQFTYRQTNSYDCGLPACINGYSMMMSQEFIDFAINMYEARYWVSGVEMADVTDHKKSGKVLRTIPVNQHLLKKCHKNQNFRFA